MFATSPADTTRGEGRAGARAAICALSPGKEDEEEKNQDRLMLAEATDGRDVKCQYAIVCDGTSTSPYAAAAAEHVSGQVQALFQAGGVGRAAEALRGKRLALLEKPLNVGEGQSPLLRSMYEEIVKQKYQHSYQTTFVAVCLRRDEGGAAETVSVKAVGCGDSALFIFREGGELLYNNMNVEDAHDDFRHGSPFTAVLPDSYDEETGHLLFDFRQFPADAHLLLCSDGLYDGFANFQEIHDWLSEHRAELSDPALRGPLLSELHDRLGRKKGDDDISFIWLHPAAPPPEAPEPEAERPSPAEDHGERGPGRFAKLLAAFLRLFKFSPR
jgi:serine/threonine protein phosphatase PrpC